MMNFFFGVEQRLRQDALDKLIQHSSPRRDFFVLTLLAVIIASAGLVTDNVAFIIASMLVAPVLYPLLSLAMGIVAVDLRLVLRSLLSLVASFLLVIVAAYVFGLLAPMTNAGTEIIRRVVLTPYDWIVAVVAGIAASMASSKPTLNEAFPGVAIAVSIVPPLAVIGLGMAWTRPDFVNGASSVLFTNALCIVAASILVFLSQGFFMQSKATNKALAKDEHGN